MGVVYVAEQTEPVRRKVALKLIKLGMDTKPGDRPRFEAERQALALMNHPNVAKVFDAGVTESWPPLLRDGVRSAGFRSPSTATCAPPYRRRSVSSCSSKVCEAIQHAHQKGIIHRDIKPSNVLVESKRMERPTVQGDRLRRGEGHQPAPDGENLLHAAGTFDRHPGVHEPGASAVNASGSGHDGPTSTPWGCLLYELLVGALPFDTQTLRRAATVEMLRIIREEDPPKPATARFSSLGDTASRSRRGAGTCGRPISHPAASRRAGVDHHAGTWRRTRPVATPRHIGVLPLTSEDISTTNRWWPVPPSRSYRLKKLIKKNKGPCGRGGRDSRQFFALRHHALARRCIFRSEAAKRQAEAEALRNRLDSPQPCRPLCSTTPTDTASGPARLSRCTAKCSIPTTRRTPSTW